LTQKSKKKQKIFIEALEQRIMLDGAGASTFLDLIDERNQEEITMKFLLQTLQETKTKKM
jgi:hypothetical protein